VPIFSSTPASLRIRRGCFHGASGSKVVQPGRAATFDRNRRQKSPGTRASSVLGRQLRPPCEAPECGAALASLAGQTVPVALYVEAQMMPISMKIDPQWLKRD